jgi:hypothetical protein
MASRGVLRKGKHYLQPGPFPNSPWQWEVIAIEALIKERRSLPNKFNVEDSLSE